MKVVTDAGETIDLGTTETAPTIGIRDFSRRVTDDFGVTTVVERGFSRTMSVKVAVPFENVDRLQRRLADLRATAARFVADDRFASLSVRGFYKDLEFDLAFPPLSYCTLTLEGLVASDTAVDAGGDPAPEGQPSTLQLLQPAIVTGGVLVASSVPETDAAEWSPTTTYADGARVIRAATHRLYESLVDANRGEDPASGSTKWLDVGPTNRWAMFDQALGTSTAASGSVTVTLDAGTVDAIALLDVVGDTVRVQAGSYDRVIATGAGAVTFLDLAGRTGQVTVTVLGGNVSIGTLLIGRLVRLGLTEASPTAAITDFSRKEVDDFGEVTVVQRAWAKRMAAKALIRTDAIDVVSNRIAAVRARPSLWIGQAGLDSLTVYGFFKDFSIEVGESVSKLSLSIEGLSKAAKPAPLKVAVDWSELTDRAGTKPTNNADKTSENTSKDTAAVGGRPATEILPKIDRIAPIAAAQDLLAQAAIANEAFTRQADRARQQLEVILLKVAAEQNWPHEILRQAGIVIDQVAGTVRIYALDRQAERLNTAEILLDATKALVSTKVDATYVGQAIAAAQLSPADLAALNGLVARVTSAETRLDGLAAQVATKAEAATLTALTGTVTAVSQVLDALTGEVRTKVSTTVFGELATRVGSVEQTVLALGDVSGITTTIRQARAIGDAATLSSLQALLSADEAARRQIVAAAQARQELTTGITDAGAATARLATLLTAQIGNVDARYAAESVVRASQIAALTEQTTALSAMVGGLGSTVSQQFQSVADQLKAQASATQQVRADLDGKYSSEVSRLDLAVVNEAGARAQSVQQLRVEAADALVLVDDRVDAVVDRAGKIEATRTIAIDSNGNLVGTKLIGSSAGPGTLALINADLSMGTGRVIFNTGTVMLVQGVGFGAQRDLVLWFGPTMAIGACSRANGTMWLTTDNAAYFGGGLSAGVLHAPGGSAGLSATEQTVVGPFGSNGGRVSVVASWSYSSTFSKNYAASADGVRDFRNDCATYGASDQSGYFGATTVQRPGSTIILSRSRDGANYEELGRGTFTTETRTFLGSPPTPGDAPGRADISLQTGGGFTVNDPLQTVDPRWLRLSLSRGFDYQLGVSQRLSISAREG